MVRERTAIELNFQQKLDFIEFVRGHPALWDKCDENYRDVNYTNRIMLEFADDFLDYDDEDSVVKQLKQTWSNLRAQYSKK